MANAVGHDGLGHFYGTSLVDVQTGEEIEFPNIFEKGDKLPSTDIEDAGEFGIKILESSARDEALNQLGIDLDGIQGKEGPQGPRGPEGPEGPAGPAGPAGLTWKHQWDSTATYVADDAVGYAGASWFCLKESIGNEPNEEDSQYWALLASQGARGPQGPEGPEGPQGIQGVSGKDGSNGADGKNGTNGVGISSIEVGYKLSDSSSSVPTGTWESSIPSIVKGKYLWTRSVIKLTDGTSYPEYTLSYQGIDGINGTNGTNGKDGADGVFKVSDLTDSDVQALYSKLKPLTPQKFWAYRVYMQSGTGQVKEFQLGDLNIKFQLRTSSADSVQNNLYIWDSTKSAKYMIRRFTVYGTTSLEGKTTPDYKYQDLSKGLFQADDYDYADGRSQWTMNIVDSENRLFYVVTGQMDIAVNGARYLYVEVNKVGPEGYIVV